MLDIAYSQIKDMIFQQQNFSRAEAIYRELAKCWAGLSGAVRLVRLEQEGFCRTHLECGILRLEISLMEIRSVCVRQSPGGALRGAGHQESDPEDLALLEKRLQEHRTTSFRSTTAKS
jgi:hypothetical protein